MSGHGLLAILSLISLGPVGVLLALALFLLGQGGL